MKQTKFFKSLFLVGIITVCSFNLSAQAILPVNSTFANITTSVYSPLPTGFTSSLVTGYAAALKFATTGSSLVLNFNSAPGVLSFDLGVNNSFPGTIPTGATFILQESTNGTLYTPVATYTNVAGGTKTITNLQNTTRYIRWTYSLKLINYNIALKNVSLLANVSSNTLSLTTQATTSLASTTATLNGTITSFDASSAFANAYGFCWSTTVLPTITDSKVDKGFSSTTGAYSHSISNLSPFTTYYVRAYATNSSAVTIYGDQVNFTTTTGLSAVSTQATTTIASTTATLNGAINSLGDTPVTAHGFCWNTVTSPTIENSKIDLGVRNATGALTSDISSLLPSTTYYVRSFATNNAGTTYGSEVNFTTTSGLATMSTQAATSITSTTTSLNGTIISFDSSTAFVNSYGFCWNTTGSPTVTNTFIDKGFSSTIGDFSHSISNLTPNTTYYVRAYSLNAAGTPSYGSEISFSTTTGLATINTQPATTVISTNATLNATIDSLGDTPVTAYGFCWDINSIPTTNNSKNDLGNCLSTGVISSVITSFSPSTKYYVRSYATNSGGTIYGNEINFSTTSGLASLSSQAASSILSTTATLNATILSLGDSPVTSYGFYLNTNGSPTITDFKFDLGATSTLGVYTYNLTGISPNTTYYVRPYITNSAGTVTGSEISFSTPSGYPTVSTQATTMVTGTTAILNGTLSGMGDTPPTSYGFCWSTTGTPTIEDIKIDKGALNVTGVYAHNITNLELGKVYYVRAYATNNVGTSYGSLQAFQTLGVVFNVTVPVGTNECWIAGNFNNWTQTQYKMSKIDATHYSVTLDESTFVSGVTKSNIAYKYYSGPELTSIEKDAAGMEMINRSYSTSDVVARWAVTYVPNLPAVPQTITFNALVPENTQACFLLGTFNNWANPTDSTFMTRGIPANGQVMFSKTITVPDINTLQFRFCAGPDWSYEQSNPVANFSYTSQNMQSIVYSFKSVYQIALPAPAGSITGYTLVCPGQNAVIYTVPTISDATSYIWTLPNGATGTSTTNSITVDYSNSAASGNVKVFGRNMFGDGAESTLSVIVNPLPSTAGTISGASTVCQGQSSVVYTVLPIDNATSYLWTLPNGATGTSTTNTITVDYSNTAVSGNITVKGSNNCGDGIASTLPITLNLLPINTGTITGSASVCLGQSSVVYTTSAIANATTYEWTLPTGATGTSTSASITVDFDNTAVSGAITVKGVNDCGKSPATLFNITVNQAVGIIGAISGATTVCQAENGLVYSVPAVDYATLYTWLLPTGASGLSTTNSITVNFSSLAQSGDVVVRASNGCSNTQFASMAVIVNQKPATPVISHISDNNGYYLHSNATTGNQWYNGNGIINGATSQDYNSQINGIYYVSVNNGSCTSDVSNSIVINATSLSTSNAIQNFKFYPNPVRNELHIDTDIETRIEIINLMGSVVYSANLDKNTIIETSNLLSGVYLLKLNQGNNVDYKKFLKE